MYPELFGIVVIVEEHALIIKPRRCRGMGVVLAVLLLMSAVWSEEVSIILDYEGRSLKANAEWVVPEGVDPKKRGAVLWLHGLFQTHKMMEPVSVQREAWVSAGLPVLSPTLTLGINDRKKPYDCSYPLDHEYELNLKEIERWVDWLISQGVRKIVLAGHSMGGQQVIHALKKLKNKGVVGLLAVAPSKGTKREHPLLKKAEELYRKGKGSELMKTSFFYCSEAEVSARTLFTYYGIDRHIGRYLKEIELPVLIVWGGEDTRVKDLPEFLNPYIKGKGNVRIEVIDYADHFFRDLASEDLSSIAVEFFEQVLK
jgi:pimeloyl-ACP methyl ester carboxylesterase